MFEDVEFSSALTFKAKTDISLVISLSSKDVTCCVTLLADILASAIVPVKLVAGTEPLNDDAVTIPENVAPPYTFKVAPVPTFISDVVVKPDIIRPF